MAPNPLAVWAAEHNVEYDDSKLAWALLGHLTGREEWFNFVINRWKEEEKEWIEEKKEIAAACEKLKDLASRIEAEAIPLSERYSKE